MSKKFGYNLFKHPINDGRLSENYFYKIADLDYPTNEPDLTYCDKGIIYYCDEVNTGYAFQAPINVYIDESVRRIKKDAQSPKYIR